jgi:4-hydroxy-3-polyprenylbenzoate decarboxylase
VKFVVAISGASGVIYGVRLVEELRRLKHEVTIITTENAKKVAEYEQIKLPKTDFNENDIDAPIASGSFKFDGLIVCPCSMKTLAAIAHGFSYNLVTRAADVALKERRKIVLVLRETPLSPIHLENALKLSHLGVQIMPASPGFYSNPKNIDDMINFIVGRVMDQFDIKHNLYKKWNR